ncbi:hypothetical protein B0J18DRAFT_81873 [Chaetomium sp. MPI-SDFR-AT-0129]|nr:hypothetical protein B0J18DRAFT_81873 [Chaetomium sp. MPI-SDFR-AT-0129]
MPMYYSPPQTPTALTTKPRSPFLPRSRSHSFSHPSSSSSPSSSRSRNTSSSTGKSTNTRSSSSTSASNNTSTHSRSTSATTTSNTSTTSKSAHGHSKTPYIFLGSIAAASYLAHTYWPRGYPHGEKEDWELSGLARRARERRAAEKRAEKAQARAAERGRKVEREVAEGGQGRGHGKGRGRSASVGGGGGGGRGEVCDCGYAGERGGRCEREGERGGMRGGQGQQREIVEEYYRSRPQRRVSFADTTAGPAKRGPYGGAYGDEVYRARDAHAGSSSRRSRSHTREREHEGRYVEYHSIPKRYVLVDPADRWAANPPSWSSGSMSSSGSRAAVSGYGFGHGEQKLVVGRQRRGSVDEKVVWDGGYNGKEWR